MAKDVPLICPTGKGKYFSFQGLTRFLKIRSDLPVGSICRGKAPDHAAIDRAATADAPRNAETRAVDE